MVKAELFRWLASFSPSDYKRSLRILRQVYTAIYWFIQLWKFFWLNHRFHLEVTTLLIFLIIPECVITTKWRRDWNVQSINRYEWSLNGRYEQLKIDKLKIKLNEKSFRLSKVISIDMFKYDKVKKSYKLLSRIVIYY